MSYRIVILPYFIDGLPVGADPDNGPFDDVIPENADLAVIEAAAYRWSRSPIGRPLEIYAPSSSDLRLNLLNSCLEEEYCCSEEMYQVFV